VGEYNGGCLPITSCAQNPPQDNIQCETLTPPVTSTPVTPAVSSVSPVAALVTSPAASTQPLAFTGAETDLEVAGGLGLLGAGGILVRLARKRFPR
jgi:hypothetical protein